MKGTRRLSLCVTGPKSGEFRASVIMISRQMSFCCQRRQAEGVRIGGPGHITETRSQASVLGYVWKPARLSWGATESGRRVNETEVTAEKVTSFLGLPQ